MWRFILLSFFFLGLAFYEMSGGADYRPSANSIQARVLLDNQRPRARPLRVNVIALAEDSRDRTSAGAGAAVTTLPDLALHMDRPKPGIVAGVEDETEPREVVMQVNAAPDGGGLAAVAQAARLWDQAGFSDVVKPVTMPAPEPEPMPVEVADLRRVAGNSVNLRSGPGTQFGRLTRLSRGTEVIVLADRVGAWVKVRLAESGDVGWMTDRLLTTATQ